MMTGADLVTEGRGWSRMALAFANSSMHEMFADMCRARLEESDLTDGPAPRLELRGYQSINRRIV